MIEENHTSSGNPLNRQYRKTLPFCGNRNTIDNPLVARKTMKSLCNKNLDNLASCSTRLSAKTQFNFLSFISPSLTFLICLFFITATAESRPNGSITRSGGPGCFWFSMRDIEGSETKGLYYTEDYGETYEHIRDRAFLLEYHVIQGVLCFNGGWLSWDGGYNYEIVPSSVTKFDWLPECDSLFAVNENLRYSFDTLRTLHRPEFNGLENASADSKNYTVGWSPGDYAAIVHRNDNYQDSLGIRFTENYADDFYLVAYHRRLGGSGPLFRGLSPGELYYLLNDSLYATADTGRSWSGACQRPLPRFIPYYSEIEPGWEPGELIWLCYNYDPHLPLETYIYRSTDFGRNWESMNGEIFNFVDTEINIPIDLTMNLWPNPTNSKFTIQFPTKISGNMIICDLLGREVFKHTTQFRSISIDLQNEASGIYFIHFETESGIRFDRNLVLIK